MSMKWHAEFCNIIDQHITNITGEIRFDYKERYMRNFADYYHKLFTRELDVSSVLVNVYLAELFFHIKAIETLRYKKSVSLQ